MRSPGLLFTVLLAAGTVFPLSWSIHEHSVYATSPKNVVALADFDPQVNELLAKMTLDEKIGQMTQADRSPTVPRPPARDDWTQKRPRIPARPLCFAVEPRGIEPLTSRVRF